MPLSHCLIPLDLPSSHIDIDRPEFHSAYLPIDIIDGVVVEIVHTMDIAHRCTRVGMARSCLYLR